MLAYAVAQRRREIGIRVALGADRTKITAMVLREGLTLTATGLVAGAALAAVSTRAIGILLHGVKLVDGPVFAAGAAILVAAAVTACLGPSLRASSGSGGGAARRMTG